MKISVFRDLFNSKETPFDFNIKEIVARIQRGTPELIEKITAIRNAAPGSETQAFLKKQLYAIMFNGTFSERNDKGLIEHSGLCVLDYDDFESDQELAEFRNKLVNDKHVMLVFTSPSGNGLKAVIKIPKSDLHEHKRRFNAWNDYMPSTRFDVKNKNVSRVCFESYDPEIFVNLECEEFKLIDQDKGYQYIEKVPVCILDDEDKKITIIEKFDFSPGFIDGNRNQFVFKLACCLCEYGISIETCESYMWTKYVQGSEDFSRDEMMKSIKSGYRRASFNSKYFEDKDTVDKVRVKLKAGVSDEEIKKQHKLSDEIIKDIREEVANVDDVFWNVQTNKQGQDTVFIEPIKYSQFLVKNGFQKYYPENAEKPTFVRVKENKVNLSSAEQIKDFVLTYLIEKGQIKVWNHCSRMTYLFNENHLNMIDSIDLKMIQDNKTESFIPFKNCVVKVTKDSIKQIPYIDINAYIWENQIIPRDFHVSIDFKNDFLDFVHKVSNEDPERIKALESTLGYMIHTFKDKTDQKAIIFNDQEIDDNPNGGSGKSLMLTALGYFRKVVKIDGKAFNPSKSDFVYQRVNFDSQVLAFDDVKKFFDFEQLFSIVSEGITVNRKNKDEVFIPFERSPKIVITTNYVIAGAGGSHDRRRHEIEFFQYFNSARSPLTEYGRLLFDSWDEVDWTKFDNYMIKNLQLFLSKGLHSTKSINANAKRFIQATSKDFYDFVSDNPLATEIYHYQTELFNQFQSDYNGYKELKHQRFSNWLIAYADYKNMTFEKDKNHKGRWIMFKTK
jgi:hypothetical protein